MANNRPMPYLRCTSANVDRYHRAIECLGVNVTRLYGRAPLGITMCKCGCNEAQLVYWEPDSVNYTTVNSPRHFAAYWKANGPW